MFCTLLLLIINIHKEKLFQKYIVNADLMGTDKDTWLWNYIETQPWNWGQGQVTGSGQQLTGQSILKDQILGV